MQKGQVTIDSLLFSISLNDDVEAFRILFHDFFPSLCVFALRYIDDKQSCEDIVQETFYKVWKNRKKLEIKTSARNFLVTTVKNACIDHLRKKETETHYQFKIIENTDLFNDCNQIYTLYELEGMIENALANLPNNIREVFEMNRFEGLTYKEIASKKNISVKTVEAYMSKALKIMRVELKDYLPFITLFV